MTLMEEALLKQVVQQLGVKQRYVKDLLKEFPCVKNVDGLGRVPGLPKRKCPG